MMTHHKKIALFCLPVIGAGFFAFWCFHDGHEPNADDLVSELVGSEELILALTPRLDRISRSLMNLDFHGLEGEFAPSVNVRDLAGGIQPAGAGLAHESPLPLTEKSSTVAREDLKMWQPLLEDVAYFDNVSLRFVTGDFQSPDHRVFEGKVKFNGLARTKAGTWAGLSAKQVVRWEKEADDLWRITRWEMKDFQTVVSSVRFFSDHLDRALPNPADRHRARHSIHQEEVIKYYKSGKTRIRSHDFSPIAMSQKPGVSVVDVDGDGFDDLYLTVRMGKNLLLRNQGDGTFEEVAETWELAKEGNSTCGIFADFDNDGDPDLMLGRSVEKSAYFENTGSWFQEVEQENPLPALVVSLSAADYDNDGLLDVYFSTYRLGALGSNNPGLGEENPQVKWPERFLSEENAAEFVRRYRKETGVQGDVDFLNQVGPPNLLMKNLGAGEFAPAPEGKALSVWKNTLQGTWSDYDDDGDADLYLANDFAPDHLFRNDGEAGFVDVAKEEGTTTYGFGMGASFGDYNNDGKQDLYVSNMFSKAGRRILSRFEGVRPEYHHSANGNILYQRNHEGRFQEVSGLGKSSLLVAEAGWSWGGQFFDFDNDGDLDIHALSGYFTAPPELASDVDL